MIRFILNDKTIATDLPPGSVLLDLVRYHEHLCGTKIGCREGDCGACTVLVGSLENGELKYQSMTSCLLPLGNVHGKHVVTIEGINMEGLNPVQQAMSDEGATQCGFCTPGFVMSLAGFCLSGSEATQQHAIAAVDGNICRCTGYKSIERAAGRVAEVMKKRKKEDPAVFVAKNKILPEYFADIKNQLQGLTNGQLTIHEAHLTARVAGGTDLYVQKHDEMTHASIEFLFDQRKLNGIIKEGDKIKLGPSVTVSDLRASEVFNQAFPNFQHYSKLVSSTPIRNMATLAGNFINASPIGDFTIYFLALDAQLILSDGNNQRTLPLRNLYKSYKTLDKRPEEFIQQIIISIPGKNDLFHFEKVSKRTHLDIASVNSAIHLKMNGNNIEQAGISAGGVGPIPLYLKKASGFLKGKNISEDALGELIEIIKTEISPIGDARGSKEYKTLLLGQLVKAHFIELFPQINLM